MTAQEVIEKIRKEIKKMREINKEALEKEHITEDVFHGRNQAQNHLFSFLDTIEVEEKEVDLEKEIMKASERYPEVSFAKLSRIAKRFYELGKKAK